MVSILNYKYTTSLSVSNMYIKAVEIYQHQPSFHNKTAEAHETSIETDGEPHQPIT